LRKKRIKSSFKRNFGLGMSRLKFFTVLLAMSLLSAASGSQLANSHPQQKNGLFSYYVMRGLNDEADANKDDQLTASELQQYVLSNVKRSANFYGRPQTPELTGDTTRVIADWRKSGPSKKSKIKSYVKKFFD